MQGQHEHVAFWLFASVSAILSPRCVPSLFPVRHLHTRARCPSSARRYSTSFFPVSQARRQLRAVRSLFQAYLPPSVELGPKSHFRARGWSCAALPQAVGLSWQGPGCLGWAGTESGREDGERWVERAWVASEASRFRVAESLKSYKHSLVPC